jgi:SAM-dependent methyltransferase
MFDEDWREPARSWDAWYRAERPPWEIDRPQPAIQRLLDEHAFRGDALDVGCGTGENTMLLASHGLHVLGIDWAAAAVDMARAKAAQRSLEVQFEVADALRLDRLGRSFDTILDSALFHTFSDAARTAYVPSLGSVARPGSMLYLLCFSELEPWGGGPRRVTQAEIRDAFAEGWTVRAIVPERLEMWYEPGYALAWLATIERHAARSDPKATASPRSSERE